MIKNIVFDWKRTLYDPDTKMLINGVKEFLDYIKSKNIPMVLIGKGGDDMEEEVNSQVQFRFSVCFWQE